MKTYWRSSLVLVILFCVLISSGCAKTSSNPLTDLKDFPDFVTSNADYYTTRIGDIPDIHESSYTLAISGLVDSPRSYTLEELEARDMVELPLTIECIGNSVEGPLLSTAVWKGFYLYDLLVELGVDENAAGVQYRAEDGYFATHTMEQIRDNKVVGALYMNGEPIPAIHGYPIRFLNPGFHGVKQPAWVTEIEVIDQIDLDYWEERGWDCSPPMAIDSTIFFPQENTRVKVGEAVTIGGAAFGGMRVTKVEITTDGGESWQDVGLVQDMDVDNVWVFWQAELTFDEPGKVQVNIRATDIEGNVQQEDDPDKYDGANDWPVLTLTVVE